MAEETETGPERNYKRNILITVDGSEHSERAFKYYMDSICRSGDNIVLVHAVEMTAIPVSPYPFAYPAHDVWENYKTKCDEDAKELLRSFGAVLKELKKTTDATVANRISAKHFELFVRASDGERLLRISRLKVEFKLIKETGEPGVVICKNIKEEDATCVIMGSRGKGTVRRTILGSVSDYVVHHSTVPVCVVPPEA